MFPAIFIISLKRCEDTQRRLEWLAHFPGDKETVTELELFLWASNNQNIFFRIQNAPSVNIISQIINGCFRCCQYVGVFSKTPPPKPKIEMAKVEEKGKMLLKDSADDDDDDGAFLGAEEDDPDFGKGKLCVPKCRSIGAMRSIFTAEASPFSQFINLVIVLNILSLAADAYSTPKVGRHAVLILNYVFISIFMLEVVVKIILLGPCLYLDSPFNLLDFTLVILSIPTFFDSSFQVLGALRILRLARLARSGQINRLYNQLNSEGTQKAPKIPIDLGRLSAMIFDMLSPMSNNIVLILVLMYIYSLIGMQFFASPGAAPYDLPPFNLTPRNPGEVAANTTATEINRIFSAGQYLPRMNFNCFGNAFVTVFNIGLLNGWYLFMINTIRLQGHEGVLWYFFSYVYFVVFLLGSTLIASVASVLDGHAKAMVRDIAGSNKSIVDRYAILSRRERLRGWFKRLKKNTIETGDAMNQKGGKVKVKREGVSDWMEDAPPEAFLTRMIRERADYSLYLLSRRSLIRRYLKRVVENIIFQIIITFAVLISVIGVISTESDMLGPLNEPVFIVAVFLLEMALLWLVYGLIGAPDAYFNQPLYLIDFFVNIAMLYAYYSKVDVLNQLRLFRMLKLPNLMLFLTDSNTLRLFFTMLFEAIPSLRSVLCMALGTTFLAGVVGVQLYTGTFSHCSYQDYPGARGRYEVDPFNFPTGCLDIGYDNTNATPTIVNGVLTGFGTILKDLHWQARLDNFDSIFTACKSCLRVIMSNEWQGILFSALDQVDVDVQPKTNYRRSSGGGSFIFFFILSLIGITIGALYVSIFYYHFLITGTLTGRKSMIGRRDAMWALYEEKLILVKQAIPVAGSAWVALAKFYRKTSVKLAIVAYCVIPVVLLIGFYGSTQYTDKDFYLYDTIFSIMYVAEYCVRGISDFNYRVGIIAIYKSTNKQEVGVVLFLIFCIFLNVRALSGGHQVVINPGKSRDIEFVCACGIMRIYRLAILFPNALRVIGVMQTSLGGFISLCIYGLIVIMIYGLLGFDVMRDLKPSYGSPFIDDNLNFRSLVNSFITLLTVGTGNYYSEVLNNLKQETKGRLGLQVFIELYFLTFYLLFFLTLKSFAIQIIIRYESTFGSSLGIAGEQVTSFQHGWRKAGLFDKVKYEKLTSLLGKHLPPPLGLAGTNPKYLELSRFVKKVLLCMPADAKRCNDDDKTGRLSRVMYPPEKVPSDIR
jgi:Ion transport protein